jgi:hypothetical protein
MKKIQEIALSFVGQEEIPTNNGFKDPAFAQLMYLYGLFQKGDYWDMEFALMVWKQYYIQPTITDNTSVSQKIASLLNSKPLDSWQKVLADPTNFLIQTPITN